MPVLLNIFRANTSHWPGVVYDANNSAMATYLTVLKWVIKSIKKTKEKQKEKKKEKCTEHMDTCIHMLYIYKSLTMLLCICVLICCSALAGWFVSCISFIGFIIFSACLWLSCGYSAHIPSNH